jgi:hypothetical protein
MNNPVADRRADRAALARKIYQSRLDRGLFFRPSLFGDSGWDGLLALYVFAANGKTISAGELCNASEASATSGLRMQKRLADLGLIRRVGQVEDRRRLLVELTEEGKALLEDYLDHLLEHHFAGSPTASIA